MTEPSHDEITDQQLVLFDLGSQEPINMTSPAFLPQLPTPPPARGKGKKASAPARTSQQTNGHSPATPATATQLEISPRPPLPELPPLLLAGVRTALFQTLAQEAHAIYEACSPSSPPSSTTKCCLPSSRRASAPPPSCSSTRRRSTPP
jgi:hypothetical protein